MVFTVFVKSVEKKEEKYHMADYYCEKCNRTMDDKQFYTSNNLTKYPDGGKLH